MTVTAVACLAVLGVVAYVSFGRHAETSLQMRPGTLRQQTGEPATLTTEQLVAKVEQSVAFVEGRLSTRSKVLKENA